MESFKGGTYKEFREESIYFNQNEINTFGIAIGGSLGSTKDEMKDVVNYTACRLDGIQTSTFIGNR